MPQVANLDSISRLFSARGAAGPLERLLPACAAALPPVVAAPSSSLAAVLADAVATPTAPRQQQQRGMSSNQSTPEAGPSPTSAAAAAAAASQQGVSAPSEASPAFPAAAAYSSSGADDASSRAHASEEAAQYNPWDEEGEEESETEWRQRQAEEEEQFRQQRAQLLQAALGHVPQQGWTGGAAAAAAAAELGLSPAAAGMLGSDAELVQHFVAECNRRLEEQLAGMQQELAELDTRGRLRRGLQLRLAMLEPYLATWPQALSLLAQPEAVPRTLQLYAALADAIWHAAGDTSTDLSWYTKRTLLTGVYSATELYMLNDCSPGFADTWAALDRRLDDVASLERAAADAGSLGAALGGAAGATLSSLAGGLGGLLPRPPS